jgi:hypothetical protein
VALAVLVVAETVCKVVIQFWLVMELLAELLLAVVVPLAIIWAVDFLAALAAAQVLLDLPVVVLVVLELRVKEMLAATVMMVPQITVLVVVVVLALLVVLAQTQPLAMVA